jgi:hypothetical protein
LSFLHFDIRNSVVAIRSSLRYGVVSASGEGVTAEYAPQAQHGAFARTVAPHGLDKIITARRNISALPPENRRKRRLIKTRQKHENLSR